MATYEQIDNYVMENCGHTVKTCWIADIKERNGLPVRRAWNRRNDNRENPCPESKLESIESAMRHFGMI